MPPAKSNLRIAVEWLWSNRGKDIWWTSATLTKGNPDPSSPNLTTVEAISIFKQLEERGLIMPAHRDGRTVFLLHESKVQEWESFIADLKSPKSARAKQRATHDGGKRKSSDDKKTGFVVIAEIIGVGILGGLSSLLSSAGYFLASLWTRFGAIAAGFALAANFFAKRRRKTKNKIWTAYAVVVLSFGLWFSAWTYQNVKSNSSTQILARVAGGSSNAPTPTNILAPATLMANNSALPLPSIRIETLAGLPEGMTNDPNLRLDRLSVRNFNEVGIEGFCSRLQLPEGIALTIETNVTTGTFIGWKPLLDKLAIAGTGGRTDGGIWIGPTSAVHFVETTPCFFYPGQFRGQLGSISKPGDFTGVWELTIDRLPPRGMVDILFLTSVSVHGVNYAEFANKPLWASPPNPRSDPDTSELRFFFEGEYRYQFDGKLKKQNFFVPIEFENSQRKFSSLPTQADISHWHPVSLVFQ